LIWLKNQPQKIWEPSFFKDSSEEYWTMHVSAIQRIDGNEENYGSCKVNTFNENYDIKFN